MVYHNILHIDDDEDDQEIFLVALKKVDDGFNYCAETDARNALDKLSNKELMADVIFLDLNMPVMNGQQFLAEIKKNERLRDIPVIILSTSSHKETIEQTKRLGARDFITKPDKFAELVHILSTILS